MSLLLLRHGKTLWNQQGRYLGRTDLPLSPEGAAELSAWTGNPPGKIFTSPMLRCRQTAEILFPDRQSEPVPGWEEMDFGIYEGRTWKELADDPKSGYQAWVDGGCLAPIPRGGDKAGFCRRVTEAFRRLAEEGSLDDAALVVHGGTIMALLEAFGEPRRLFYDWHCGNGEGWQVQWESKSARLLVLGPISSRKGNERP